MLVTDFIQKKIANIMILPATSQISHHHKVANISMSPCWWHQHHCYRKWYAVYPSDPLVTLMCFGLIDPLFISEKLTFDTVLDTSIFLKRRLQFYSSCYWWKWMNKGVLGRWSTIIFLILFFLGAPGPVLAGRLPFKIMHLFLIMHLDFLMHLYVRFWL